MSPRESRTAAEWTTFAISCVILLALIALIGVQLAAEDAPPAPVARVAGPVRVVDGHHLVDVVVVNEGDATASNVQVSADLVVDGETSSADQTIDFLAGDESEDVVFVFDDAPSDGELTVRVTGFALP